MVWAERHPCWVAGQMLAPPALVLQALPLVQPLVLLPLVLLPLVLLPVLVLLQALVLLVLLVLVPLVQPLPLLFSLTSLHVWLAAMLRTHPRQPV